MKPTNRRQFIQHTALLAGGVSIAPSLHAAGANEKFINDEANNLLRRTYREGHWAAPKGPGA